MEHAATPAHVQQAADLLRRRCGELGVPVFHLDTNGNILHEPEATGLFALWLGTATLADAFKTQSVNWTPEPPARLSTIAPGLDVLPVPLVSNRGHSGFLAACFLCPTLGFSEFFERSCEDGTLNKASTRRVVLEKSCWAPEAAEQASRMMGWMYEDSLARAAALDSQRNSTERLSSAYETISALFTIGRGMNRIADPETFVERVVEELIDATDFGWVTLRLFEGTTPVSMDQDRWYDSGSASCDSRYRREAMELVTKEITHSGTAAILDEPSGVHPSLGAQIVRQTIECDGRIAGVIIAGDKQTSDPQVSSYETLLIEAAAAFLSAFLDNAQLYADQERTFLGTIQAMSNAIDAKDRYTRGHSERVATLSRQLALAVGMDVTQAERIYISGLVHDVGKIGVPESVLTKPDRLTDHEFDLIKQHPDIGHTILSGIPLLKDVLPGVRFHHERWDGRGYPDGLVREDIPLMARILGLADTFDAMSSNRAYRSGMPREKVLAEIERCSGAQFDPDLVPHFLALDFTEYDRMNAVAVEQKPISEILVQPKETGADTPKQDRDAA